MGRRGPAPKPTALRLVDGSRRRRDHDEPVPAPALPVCPEGYGEAVAAVFDRIVTELVVMGTAAAADRDSLACLAAAVVNHRRASELLAGTQVIVRGARGDIVRNPALAVQRDSAVLIRAFAQEFGLTPSARVGVTVRPRTDPDDPFA